MKKLISILCFGLFFVGGAVLAKEVMINPITPDIRDKLRESTDLVSKVEDSMAPKVNDLEKIYKTYSETCKGNENDRGCAEMQNQIREKYKEVLSAMESELPRVRRAISSTARNLGQSIKAKTRKKDLRELFKAFHTLAEFTDLNADLMARFFLGAGDIGHVFLKYYGTH